MLNGKCKEEFEKWYDKSHDFKTGLPVTINGLYKLIESMRYGVYVDFFDSVEICIEILHTPIMNQWYYMIDDSSDEPTMFLTRIEARTAAIEKANEIYNNL